MANTNELESLLEWLNGFIAELDEVLEKPRSNSYITLYRHGIASVRDEVLRRINSRHNLIDEWLAKSESKEKGE